MSFYQSIEKYYNHIFPLNPKQLSFINTFLNENDHVLEVGSARGSLTNALSSTYKVSGIDLESSFVRQSKMDYPHIDFKVLNMTDIYPHYKIESLNGIVCFGNTIVHLKEDDLIKKFFESAYQVLDKNGVLLLQLINYDRILDGNISSLPSINNEFVRFERKYRLENNLIAFITELSIKKENRFLKNTIHLNPVRKSVLEQFLSDVGFTDISFYGGFDKSTLTQDSIPLIISCKK